MKDGGFGGEMNTPAPTPVRLAPTRQAPTRPANMLPLPGSASATDVAVLPGPPGPGPMPQCELTRKILGYDPKADTALIDSAYELAQQAHSTQRRDNGEPYFTHPVAVANILAGYRLDVASIATALLHDVVEDTPSSCRRSKISSARRLPAWSMASPS